MIKDLLKEAFILKNKNFHKHAIEILYKALEIDNTSLDLLFEIAESYYFINEEEKALEYIEQILNQNPTHIESLKLLMNLFMKKEAWEKAEQTATSIYQITDKTEDLAQILNILNKQKAYEKVFTYNTNIENAEVLYEKAFAKIQTLCYKEAEEYINKALSINQKSTKFLLLKGDIQLKLNNDDEAYKILKSMDVSNENPELMSFAGLVYQRFGEYKKSLGYFFKSAKNSKEKDKCYYNCASTYLKMGDHTQAKKYLNLAISKNPENPVYHFALANIYYKEKNYKRAIEELKSDLYESRLLRAIILNDSGYFAIAMKEFEKIIKEFPEDEIALKHLRDIEIKLKS